MRIYLEDVDSLKWTPFMTLEKWTKDQVAWVRVMTGIQQPDGALLARYVRPHEILHVAGNLLTNTGLNRISSLILGAGGQALTSTAVRLGVGDSSTAATAGDTSLGTNQYYQVMDASYPQFSNGVMTFKATFPESVANFTWQGWGLDVGTPTVTSGSTVNTLINHKIHALGTKIFGAWSLTVTLTITSP
jgi:hypothetical protein